MWITHQTVQIHGGMGYSKEMPLEGYFRDSKLQWLSLSDNKFRSIPLCVGQLTQLELLYVGSK